MASFCMTIIDLVVGHPHQYPKYMEVTDTEHCLKQEKKFDLDYIYHEALVYDADVTSEVRSLNLSTAFFEMGYTNSERLTVGLSTDYTKMVLVNAQPMDEAIQICDDKSKRILAKKNCDRGKVAELVRKVSYLMCRTSDEYYEECIVKYATESAKGIEIFELAHQEASDYFIYVDPHVYIGAAMSNAEFPERAHCAKHKNNPSEAMIVAFEALGKSPKHATIAELCAQEAVSDTYCTISFSFFVC